MQRKKTKVKYNEKYLTEMRRKKVNGIILTGKRFTY